MVAGGVPEWSKGSDCKSDGLAFEGSNPSPTTKRESVVLPRVQPLGGIESRLPRVWYNGRTSAFQADDAGSIPATRSRSGLLRQTFSEFAESKLGLLAS